MVANGARTVAGTVAGNGEERGKLKSFGAPLGDVTVSNGIASTVTVTCLWQPHGQREEKTTEEGGGRGMNEGRMYSHLLVGIFCRVQRKFIHFHLNLQLCETVVEWVLTCRGFCPEIATGCAKAEG